MQGAVERFHGGGWKGGREFQDAVREVLAANAQLLILARQQRKKGKRR